MALFDFRGVRQKGAVHFWALPLAGFWLVSLPLFFYLVFSREPRLYKRVCPSVGPSVGPLVTLLSAGRDEPANNLFCVYKLVWKKDIKC